MAFSVLENTTNIYTANLVDETGAGITLTVLKTLTLSLYDAKTLTTINSRTSQDVLNKNDVAVSSSGGLTWTMEPLDNAVVDETQPLELHMGLFGWQWGGASSSAWKVGRHQVGFSVVNLAFVP